MPQLDLDNLVSSSRQQVIEGEAKDITRRPLPDDRYTQEPVARQDQIRDREHTPYVSRTNRLPFGPLRAINPKTINSKANLMSQLLPTIPLNEYDLPNYVYRADMLDHVLIQQTLTTFITQQDEDPTAPAIPHTHQAALQGPLDIQSQLDSASIALDYSQGFPTIANGMPFWQQLPFEPREAHDAFVFYLEQSGARKLHDLIAYPLEQVTEWFHLYYWPSRVRSFDLFRIANAQKVKLQRMLTTEDTHFLQAERIMSKLNAYFEAINVEELMDKIDPAQAVGMLEKLVKIQRISVGLSAAGGKEEIASVRTDPSISITMQQIAQGGGEKKREDADSFDMLSDDPDSVDLAQQLIISQQKNGNL